MTKLCIVIKVIPKKMVLSTGKMWITTKND